MNNTNQSNGQKRRGRCIIKGCVNHVSRWTTTAASYYVLPAVTSKQSKQEKTNRRSIWIQAIVRHNKFDSDWQPTIKTLICNLHFVGSKKSDHPFNPSYNPKLFPSQKAVEADDQAQNVKRQIDEDSSENDEPLSARVSTVSHRTKKYKKNFGGFISVVTNNNLMDIAGINFKQFNFLLQKLPCVASDPNRLLIALIKLRQNLSYTALAVYFTMQESLVREIIAETLPILKDFAETRVAWVGKEVIQKHVPDVFKPHYSNCRAMIDCIEIQVELPRNVEAQKEYYLNFRNCNTFKIFVACAPNGFIMYKSKCYGGQKADGFLAQDCGFLDLIKPNDVILTDREFPNLESAVSNRGAKLKKIDVTVDSEVFPLYMHMRESLNQLKHFKILSAMPMDMLEYVDSTVQICCSLVNLHFLMNASTINSIN